MGVRLRTPNEWLAIHINGWGILDNITDSVLRYHKGPLVEIGMGASTIVLAKQAQKHDVQLYSCDLQMGGMWKAFDKALFSGHHCYIGRSDNFMKIYDDEPAVVFIDGQHDYEVVKRETDFFLEKMIFGGVLMLHDTFPPLERYLISDPNAHDVYKLRQDLERNPDYDVLTWPYSAITMGLTMVMKHERNKDRGYWQKNGRVA